MTLRTIAGTTDKQHIGLVIEAPVAGGHLRLGDSDFLVIRVEANKIVCFNYIVELEPTE